MIFIPIDNKTQYISGIYMIESHHGRKYIGSSNKIKTRYSAHVSDLKRNQHDNSRLQNYANKHGIEKLTFSIIELCDQEFLIEREQFYIDNIKPFYNICKIAGSTIGHKGWIGKKHTEETKAKIKASLRITFDNKHKIPKKSRPTKEENTIKFSQLNKSEDARVKISNRMIGHKIWLGRKHKPETILNRMGELNGRARMIECIETGEKFKTGIEASLKLGESRSAICNSISRGSKIKNIFTLKYADN